MIYRPLLRSLLAIVAQCSLSSCSPKPAPPPLPPVTPTAARAAVDSELTKLFEAYKRKDAAAFAALYSSDAAMHSVDGTMTGRPAIEKEFEKGLAYIVAVDADTITVEDFVESENHAVETGHVVWTETDKGKPPAKTRLDFALTWQREADGVWRIERDLSTEIHPKQ